jgi:predicted nucleic acid-binding protein
MGPVIALDSMVFIHLFELSPHFSPPAEAILTQIETGRYQGITSITSLIETLSLPKLENEPHSQFEITRFFEETNHLTVYPVTPDIAFKTAALRRQHPKLRTPDTTQLATAIVNHASTFITNDKKLLKLTVPGLKIQPLGLIS